MNSDYQTPLLELNHVSRSFGAQGVLSDISLQVQPGETLVLIGESGCGKSVTTKLLAGMLEPTAGDVMWRGVDVKRLKPAEKLKQRLRIGYLFQSAALFDSLNVFENIAFGLRQNTRKKNEEIQDIVYSRLVDVGLNSDVSSKMPAELSGGMRKRVGLARALAISPDIIIYDEPTTGLDPVMSDVINELILSVREQRPVTSIVVTHDMHTVQKVADRILMLYPLSRLPAGENQVIFSGTADDAFHADDVRVYSFVHGDASQRLHELSAA